MHKICLTNDDGPYSNGLLKLAERLSKMSDLTVIVPDGQRSATAKSLTLNRPLRVNKAKVANGYTLITHNGTPADSVILATHFMQQIDLFVSGINAGGNIGYQSMLTSGTVGAAFEASLKGYPAIAVSMEANPTDWFNPDGSERDFGVACDIIANLAVKVLEKGLPDGIDALNVNLPCEVTVETEVEVTRPIRVRMTNTIDARVDPHGREYFWIKGTELNGDQGDDMHSVLEQNRVSVSPIVIESVTEEDLVKIRQFIEN